MSDLDIDAIEARHGLAFGYGTAIRALVAEVRQLRERIAMAPCRTLYGVGEVPDEENACHTHEGPWPCPVNPDDHTAPDIEIDRKSAAAGERGE